MQNESNVWQQLGNEAELNKQLIADFYKAVQDEWWRTDPAGLMWIFSLTEWRFKCAAILRGVAEMIDIP
ncbi:MAG: hypothetical protein KME47_09900 [Nodosilinea sp. WJT8-NPBG4]|jgi:hypothetical protein|nr:hypothetical protein [Nodosilinea sp. WJT8-NPBG4]